MGMVVYKLENGKILLLPEDTRVAIIDPEDRGVSTEVLPGKEYVRKLRELADAIDSIDNGVPTKPPLPEGHKVAHSERTDPHVCTSDRKYRTIRGTTGEESCLLPKGHSEPHKGMSGFEWTDG